MFRHTEGPRFWAREVGRFGLCVAILMVRTVGAVLPGSMLWVLLWPVAFLRAAWELNWGRPTFAEFRTLAGPPLLPRGRALTSRRLLLGRTRLNLAKLLFLWPEKLASRRGATCRIVGADRLAEVGAGGPALLLTLHFGPLGILLNLLRARGHPAAMVALKGRRQLPWYRRHLVRKRDAPAGLLALPSLIELGQVWEMRDHLDAGGHLLVAVDGGHGRHCASPIIDGLGLSMSTGALQLAALTGVPVVPCLIRSGPALLPDGPPGRALAADIVADKLGRPAACAHLLREFLPTLAAAPEECSYELLAALRRTDLDAGSRSGAGSGSKHEGENGANGTIAARSAPDARTPGDPATVG